LRKRNGVLRDDALPESPATQHHRLHEEEVMRIRYPLWGLLVIALAWTTAAHADADRCGPAWTASWGAAMQAPLFAPAPTFANQTLRQIVHLSAGGEEVRVRFSNASGATPLTLPAATVGVRAQNGNVVPGTLRPLSFGGQTSITIPPRAEAVSDAVALPVDAQADLAISLYVLEPTLGTTQLTQAHQTSYLSGAGDFTDSPTLVAASTFTSWYWLTGVDVRGRAPGRTIVALGDSITEGFATATDANARWPDVLARRLLARGRGLAVVDMGISGNRVLNEELGPNAQSRLDRDVLTVPGAAFVILLEGINDIGFSQFPAGALPPTVPLTNVSADEIIAGYRQIVRRAHGQGKRVLAGTLLPFVGAFYQDAAAELKREAVNRFIRTSGLFDGVIDFEAAVRDPANPQRLNPAFDSGDHLHPNAAGYTAMANAIDLHLFDDAAARRCDAD
jgi:lysophospholipase L1-like esterase